MLLKACLFLVPLLLADAEPPARQHWAFVPPAAHEPPEVRDATWARGPLDRFILTRLEEKALAPAPEADRRTLLRRVSYDLTGLPPTFEETQAFLDDDSPDALERLTDRLLASPRHGERWGRYWLDVARYADTKGYVYSDREERRFVHSTSYRDWVIRALNEDMPYDRFLLLQLAADRLEPEGSPHLAAMGFLTLGRRFLGVIHDIIDDRIDTVFRGTQALTVSCARCHDHKFDPIPTLDYYSLYGIFVSSSERTVELAGGEPAPEAYRQELAKRIADLDKKLEEKKEAVASRFRARVKEYLLAVLDVERLPTEEFYAFLGPDDLNPVVVRQWHAYIFASRGPGQSIFAPWRAFAGLKKDAFARGARAALDSVRSESHPLVLAAFERKLPGSMEEVARTYGELLHNPTEEALRSVLHGPGSPASVPPGPVTEIDWLFDEPTRVELGKLQSKIDAWRIEAPGSPGHAVLLVDRPVERPARVFVRGNPAQKGEEAPRRFLTAISRGDPKELEHGSGRLGLARAIAAPDNPLTARVLVNRVWLHHFGAGLVRTPSDFGLRAEPPSHPELLDFLSQSFVDGGWSIKRLHRELVPSSAYRQSSEAQPEGSRLDPENRLLHRANRTRLDFEALRDSLLAASGELELAMGGRPADIFAEPFSTRRTVYGLVDRQFLPGTFRVFDVANPDQHTPERHATTVPQQALFLLNSPFVAGRARAVARRKEIASAARDSDRIGALWEVVLGRRPVEREVETALAYLTDAREEPADPGPPGGREWSYGFGRYVEPSGGHAGRIEGFTPLPHFTGEAWQGGPKWPDEKLGWVQLTAAGGHAGNDLSHAAVRRWTAPRAGRAAIEGTIAHVHKPGDGVRARVVSSRFGSLGEWSLHDGNVETQLAPIEVKPGDTIDFVVDLGGALSNDDFLWAPTVRLDDERWSAREGFGGPRTPPLTPLESLAQALLVSNELVFVD